MSHWHSDNPSSQSSLIPPWRRSKSRELNEMKCSVISFFNFFRSPPHPLPPQTHSPWLRQHPHRACLLTGDRLGISTGTAIGVLPILTSLGIRILWRRCAKKKDDDRHRVETSESFMKAELNTSSVASKQSYGIQVHRQRLSGITRLRREVHKGARCLRGPYQISKTLLSISDLLSIYIAFHWRSRRNWDYQLPRYWNEASYQARVPWAMSTKPLKQKIPRSWNSQNPKNT